MENICQILSITCDNNDKSFEDRCPAIAEQKKIVSPRSRFSARNSPAVSPTVSRNLRELASRKCRGDGGISAVRDGQEREKPNFAKKRRRPTSCASAGRTGEERDRPREEERRMQKGEKGARTAGQTVPVDSLFSCVSHSNAAAADLSSLLAFPFSSLAHRTPARRPFGLFLRSVAFRRRDSRTRSSEFCHPATAGLDRNFANHETFDKRVLSLFHHCRDERN